MNYLAVLLLFATTLHAMEFPGYPNQDLQEVKVPSNPLYQLENIIGSFQSIPDDLEIKEVDQRTELTLCFSQTDKDFYINCLRGGDTHLHMGKIFYAHFDRDNFLIAKKYSGQSKISYVSCVDLKDFFINKHRSHLEFSFNIVIETLSIKQLGFSAKHQKFFVLDDEGKLKQYCINNFPKIRFTQLMLPSDEAKVTSFSISPDETYLAAIFQNNAMITYNIVDNDFPDLEKDAYSCKMTYDINKILWNYNNKLVLLQSFTELSDLLFKLEAGCISIDLQSYNVIFDDVALGPQEFLCGVMSDEGDYFVFLQKKQDIHDFSVHIYDGRTFYPHATIDCKHFCQSFDTSIDKLAFDAQKRLVIITKKNLYYVDLSKLTWSRRTDASEKEDKKMKKEVKKISKLRDSLSYLNL